MTNGDAIRNADDWDLAHFIAFCITKGMNMATNIEEEPIVDKVMHETCLKIVQAEVGADADSVLRNGK